MSLTFLREEQPAPGAVEQLAPGLRRVLCGNPSPFTYRGTNSWILGSGRVAVVDPGPEDAAQLEALLEAVRGERVTHILVTHTHRDHSPGARALAAATGAPILGCGPHRTPPAEGGEGGDHAYRPDHEMADGESLEGEDWRIEAIATPGHCANHLCFAVPSHDVLLSGDQVMSWSTSVVSPPDGDMADYMRSLALLADRTERLFLPGHGPPLPEPARFVAGLAAHRREREARVIEALHAAGEASAEALVPAVYGPALDPRLVRGAARSLLAHLLKLRDEGVAEESGGLWRLARG
jgi:glyoxylase-like metal-dependent hydrolase (beta-lactamase superfamily II)